MADEPMVRVPKKARENIFLARGIQCCSICSLTSISKLLLLLLYEGVEVLHDYSYCQIMLRVNNFVYKPEAVRNY
jgi:hypothetical protein